jgi:protein-S-isoprenylcysteine O-methyltransferase Ste14
MLVIPDFEIGVWNAWVFIVPFLLVTYGLSFLIVNRESTLFSWPAYNKQEKPLLSVMMVCWIGSWIYSIFVPLKLGTVWFYIGLPIYLVGLIFTILATLTFARTSPDEPNTQGIYRISRHPMYMGFLLICLGIGIAFASWIFLLWAVVFMIIQHILVIPEERYCLEKYGDAYREYMHRTPRWIGIPKS